MALSSQEAVSDGTLATLAVSLEYFSRSEITVTFDGAVVAEGAGWVWVGTTDKQINFSPNVPNGVVVKLQRRTAVTTERHSFSEGAAFKATTLDENFDQIIRVAQEQQEGAYPVTDIFDDVDMHGKTLLHIRDAVALDEPATLGQVQAADSGAVLATLAGTNGVLLVGNAADKRDLASTASGKGAALVGFLQSGTGAIDRTLQDKGRERVTAKDFATGNGTTNDGASLRQWLASPGATGGRLLLGKATYKTDASGGTCLAVTAPLKMTGDGGVYTAINPASASASDNTITVTPPAAYDHTLMELSGLSLHDPSTGSRTGNHGIYADTQVAGANLAKFTLRDLMVGQGSGRAFYHLNNPVNNVNGGLYTSLIDNCVLKGGVRLESSGDSNSVVHSTLSGTGWGVWASLVAGASLLEVQANNITTSYGAFRLEAGPRFRFIGNNCEHNAVGAAANNNSAVINVAGGSGAIYGGVIKESLVSAFGSTDATTLIRLRNCHGTAVEDNVLLSGSATTTTGIDVGSDCQDVRIGPNTFNAGLTTQVLDSGVGTMGVVKTPTLQNSWVAFGAGQATLKFIKSADGMVHVYGAIKNGMTTNGTLVATLPVGFRPSEIIRSQILVVNSGTPQVAETTIESDGSIRISYVLSSNQVDFNLSFPASSLANAVSAE